MYLGPVDLWLGWLLLVMHLFGRVFVYVDLLQAHLSVDKVVRVRLTLERDVWRLVSILMGKFPIRGIGERVDLSDGLVLDLIFVQVPQILILVRRGARATFFLFALGLGIIHDSGCTHFIDIDIAFLSLEAIRVCM